MVTNSSYKLSQSLLDLQHDGILCDVTINAGNGSVHAHSAILAAANPILRSLFEKQAAEASIESRRLQYVVDLHDFSLDSIVTSLQSVYVGKVVGLCTMEEKDWYLRLTALGLGIPNAHVADTTSCQSSGNWFNLWRTSFYSFCSNFLYFHIFVLELFINTQNLVANMRTVF